MFEHTQSGPVAQLGARLNGIQEVTGSTPVRSTNFLFSLQRLRGFASFRLQNVSTRVDVVSGISRTSAWFQQANRRFERRRTQVHVALCGAQLLVSG